jgi:hypothetical protein
MFQDLPLRIDRSSHSEGRRRKFKFHPMMFDDLIHMSPYPTIGIKIALSMYKDKMPWVYNEGIALINKISSSKSNAVNHKILFKEFEELLMISARNPFVEELMMNGEADFILFHELPRIILRNLERILIHQK